MTLPSTRAAALTVGADRYFTGQPCRHGHVAERYVTGSCVACRQDHYQSRRPEFVERARLHRKANGPQIAERRRTKYRETIETRRVRRLAYFKVHWFAARAQNLRGPGHATARDLARIWKEQRGHCALIGRRLDRSAEFDHIVPKARGGSDRPENLRWVVKAVNRAKRDLLDADFLALCRAVIAHAEAAA